MGLGQICASESELHKSEALHAMTGTMVHQLLEGQCEVQRGNPTSRISSTAAPTGDVLWTESTYNCSDFHPKFDLEKSQQLLSLHLSVSIPTGTP